MGSRHERGGLGTLTALFAVVALGLIGSGAALADPVGATSLHYVDDQRRSWDGKGPRPLETNLWYPSAKAASPGKGEPGLFEMPDVAPDAPIADGGRKYPLVVISHGTGGCATGMLWLGHYLASPATSLPASIIMATLAQRPRVIRAASCFGGSARRI